MSRRPATVRSDAHAGHLRLDRLASDHAVFRQVLKAIVEAQATSKKCAPKISMAMRPSPHCCRNWWCASSSSSHPVWSYPRLTAAISRQSVCCSRQQGKPQGRHRASCPIRPAPHIERLDPGLGRSAGRRPQAVAVPRAAALVSCRHLTLANTKTPTGMPVAATHGMVRRDDAVREAVTDSWLGSSKLKTPA